MKLCESCNRPKKQLLTTYYCDYCEDSKTFDMPVTTAKKVSGSMSQIKDNKHTVTFSCESHGTVAVVSWGSGKLTFKGDIEAGAEVFFEFLKRHVDFYIQEKTKEKEAELMEEFFG